MSDDFVAGGVPVDNVISDDEDFDPDALESDDLLDDVDDGDMLTDDLSSFDDQDADLLGKDE